MEATINTELKVFVFGPFGENRTNWVVTLAEDQYTPFPKYSYKVRTEQKARELAIKISNDNDAMLEM